MTGEAGRQDYERVYAIFAQVCSLEPSARAAALRSLCGSDAVLHAEVEALLAEDAAALDFLDSSALGVAFGAAGLADDDPEDALVGQCIAGFMLERVIQSGGMGTVYLAVQEKPARTVALKVMRHGLLSRAARRRFEYETQVLARLQHPGIAQVYQVGTYVAPSGVERPFFAMEFVREARSITEFADQAELGSQARLELFIEVCEAVQHGHQRGVIHRDLKPANVLVDPGGQPKIIDFGVAKATDADMALTTLNTEVGQLIGTLQYMSPEQCEAAPIELDTRSDVYSLGLVLYELLCGAPPYDVSKKPVHEAVRIIKETDPRKPSAIKRVVRGDLETIMLRAIEKERERRYPSALELAQDLRRFLADEPIHARPPSAFYQLRKFAKRNRALSGGVVATFIALVAGVVTTAAQADRASRAEKEALARAGTEKELRESAESARSRSSIHEREARRQAAIAEQVNEFLEVDLLGSVDPAVALGREVTVREVFDAAAGRIEGKFEDEPLIEASIRATLGRMYLKLSDYESALPQLERARDLLRVESGEENPRTLAAMEDLGRALTGLARYEEAGTLLDRVLEARRLTLGEYHEDTLTTLYARGAVYRWLARYDEALECFERVRDHAPEKLHLEARAAIAVILMDRGEFEDARLLFQAIHDESVAWEGEGHPETLDALVKLAACHMMLRDFDVAEPLFERALELATPVLGEDHVITLSARGNVLWMWLEQGRYAEAIEPCRDLVARHLAKYGDDHPDAVIALSNLGHALVHLQRCDEALGVLETALAGSRKTTPGHWLEAGHLALYGQALAGLGRGEEAARALYEARDIAIARLGPTDDRTLTTRWDLIEFLLSVERNEEAAGELAELVPILDEVHGEDFRGADPRNEYGVVLWKLGRYAEALEIHEAAYRIRSASLGPDHVETRKSLYNVVAQLIGLDRRDEAIEKLEALKQACLRSDGERSRFTVIQRVTLAMLLNREGRPAEALGELDIAMPYLEEDAPDSPLHAMCLLYRGDALTALGRFEEAEDCLLRSHSMLEEQESAKGQDAIRALVELYARWQREPEHERWSALLDGASRGK